jgi:histidinol-phosphate aminotransferase
MNKKQIGPLARLHGYWLYQHFLRHTRAWSRDRREAYVVDRLKTTLVRAYDGVPFYRRRFRDAGFNPATDFRSPADLAALPILTKDDVRANYHEMIDPGHRRTAVEASTSGTTGEPMMMLLNESYIAFDYATMFRHWAQAGYTFRARYLALRSYVPKTHQDPLWYYNRPQNTLYMSAYHLSPTTAARYVEEVLKFRPKFIRGYPSSLNVLAEYAYPYRDKLDFVNGLFTASETLLPPERDNIERTFGKKLFDWYGMTEPVLVITETQCHTGMEVNWEYGFAEFLPSPDLPPGEFRLVATSFHNPVMPFIRYDTGDIVRLREGGSEDGLYPPLIHSIAGRKDECIVTPDGRRLPSVNFYTVFRDHKEVLKFQIVQYGLSDVVVKLALRPDVKDPASVVDSLRQSLQVRIGGEVRIDFEITEKFITNPDGKTVPILRRSGSRAVEENEEYVISSQQAWLPENVGLAVLKLDWNEADWTPAGDQIRATLQKLLEEPRYLNWYPAAESNPLTVALTTYAGVPPDRLLVTHGSDGAIESLGVAFIKPGDRALMVQPTYDHFRASIEQHGATSTFVRYDGTIPFPLEELRQRITLGTPRLIYLNNPNNPIGYALELPDLEQIIRHCAASKVLVVVDEAYFEFCGVTVAPLTAVYPNVIALRTFSKAFGLAGLRIGYILASADLARVLRRVVNPKSVTMFAKAAALTALENVPSMREFVAEVAASREKMREFLQVHGIESYPSRANYILFQIDQPWELLDHFAAAKVFLRDRSRYFPRGRHVRMTIGTLQSTARVIEVFEDFLRSRRDRVGREGGKTGARNHESPSSQTLPPGDALR